MAMSSRSTPRASHYSFFGSQCKSRVTALRRSISTYCHTTREKLALERLSTADYKNILTIFAACAPDSCDDRSRAHRAHDCSPKMHSHALVPPQSRDAVRT